MTRASTCPLIAGTSKVPNRTRRQQRAPSAAPSHPRPVTPQHQQHQQHRGRRDAGSGEPGDETLYIFYTADDCENVGIGLMTSRPLAAAGER